MKRIGYILIILFCFTGCARKVEMSQLGIVSGIGIDKLDDKNYRVTAQIVNPTSIAGNQHDTLAVFSISADGSTIYEAYRKLNTLTTKVLYLPHLSVIVINEEMAKAGIDSVIDFSLRNVMVRPNISLVVANNSSAQQVLEVLVPSEQIPINQLDSLSGLCEACSARGVSYNLYNISGMLDTVGKDIVLNSVAIIGDEGEIGNQIYNILQVNSPTQLQVDSLAVFKNDQLTGYLTTDEAQLYNLLIGNDKRYILNAVIDEGEYIITAESRHSDVEFDTDIDNHIVKISCKVEGVLMENEYPIDLMNPENIHVLEGHLSEALREEILSFMEKTKSEFSSDVIGIGNKLHQKDYKKWAEISGYWEDIYPTLEFEVEVDLKLNSIGDIANLTE